MYLCEKGGRRASRPGRILLGTGAIVRAAHLTEQPGPRIRPISVGCGPGDAKGVGGLLYVSAVHDLQRRDYYSRDRETFIRRYHDELIRLFVDVSDTPENQQYFRELKVKLKVRFQQIDIRMTTDLIEA